MISKPKTISTYFKAYPIKSVVLSVFTLFTILGAGFGTFAIVAPDNADALITGGPGCCGGWGGWDPWPGFPNPVIDPDPFPGGGGGGGSIIPSCTLSVVPGSVNEGDPVSITWTTTNGVAANIDNGIGPVNTDNGSINRTPLVDTTYTMTVVSATGHTATCSDDVVVIPPVDTTPTCTLSVGDINLSFGESTNLTWTTNNATNVSISPVRWGVGGSNLALNGSQTITPEESTTYTLTATDGDGDSVTCTTSVTVDISVNPPVCTLSINPESITLGQSATILWETRHADSFRINRAVGPIALTTSPVANGTVTITPTSVGTFTYTGTAENTGGDSVTCSDTIVVTPVDVNAPICTLVAGTNTLGAGETTTLTWTTQNATFITLQHLDAVHIVDANGEWTGVVPGTYTLTASNGAGDSVTCVETITRVVTPSLTCDLLAADTTLDPGQRTTLTWTTTNATEVTIQHLDAVSIVALNGTWTDVVAGTYTLRASNGTDSITCVETITVNVPGGLACTLDIDRQAMRNGESAELTWTTTNAVSFDINGEDKDLNGTETIRPVGIREHTYTGTATDASGNTVTCSDTIRVEGGTGGSSLQCALRLSKSVIRAGETSELIWETKKADTVEIDRGIGEVARVGSREVSESGVGRYQYVLTARGNGDVVSCRAELIVEGGSGGTSPRITIDLLRPPGDQPFAFVTLSQIPYTGIELGPIGTVIYWVFLVVWSGAVAYITLFKLFPFLGRKMLALGGEVQYIVDDVKEGTMEVMEAKHDDIQMEGFDPHPSNEESLSIEDIVRGLSRKQEQAPVVEEEEVFDTDVITEMSQPPVAEPTSGDDVRFLNALMHGDRDTTFGILRRSVRNGQRPEVVLEGVIVHLDSAYRARVEGAPCSDDVRRACAACDTGLLEEVIAALTSAIDTTYSHAGTGAKLALTRAHAIIDRG